MKLTETIKLYLSDVQAQLLKESMHTYIATVNGLVAIAVNGTSIATYTSKDVHANLPSALKNQCIRDAKSIVKKYKKNCQEAEKKNKQFEKEGNPKRVTAKLPILKKPCFYVNNQNFKIKGSFIEFPVMVNGKSTRLSVSTKMTDQQKAIFSSAKLGTMRIVLKNNKIVSQVSYEAEEPTFLSEGNIMGVDLGIKCPAVSKCSDGSVKFYGNGRKNKQIRRHYASKRKKLQKGKHKKALKKMNNKEERIMNDIDHKISREIVDTAIAHNVKIIKLEKLSNIRSRTRTSRKNNHSLHNWSFYRLSQYIEYKARLAGIEVVYVNPAYTSQTCPICGKKNHAKDRNYQCECGFHTHRDLLGAINICNSTEYVGDSNK